MTAAETLLPARRRDLIFTPLGDDGQHVVKDPVTGAYFKLGPEESFLFARLHGGASADDVCRAFSRHFGEPLSEADLHAFLALAEESGFLARPAPAREPVAGVVAHDVLLEDDRRVIRDARPRPPEPAPKRGARPAADGAPGS